MRVGYQFNETVLTYDGFKSYFYNGTNVNSGLNDASFIAGGSFDPENLVTPYNDGTRTAVITSTGGTKTLRKNYFNLSTSTCSELWVIPPNTYRIAFDIYFKLKVGYTPADYNLNTPGYGFSSPNFIAQFIGSLTENLTDPKKEIAMVIITSGQNPYQPFDQNGTTCGSLGVNPVAINDANINFINPIDGVLSSSIENTVIETQANESFLKWDATNNELIESFEIESLNDLNIPTSVTGKLEADESGGTSAYQFRLPKESFTGAVYYRIKSIGKMELFNTAGL